jgi:large subunit ribosomal protein L25
MAKSATHQTDKLTIETRDRAGTTAAQAVRREGKIPGVLYGHGEPTPIAIEIKALEAVLLRGKSHVLEATVGGKHDSVLLRGVQRHPVTHKPIHVDFQRVIKGEAVTATLPVVITGVSPAVKEGAVMDLVTRSIDVKGPSDKLPDNITIDVSEMGVHTHVSAGDVKLPAGFTLVTPHDTVLISIEASRTAQQAEPVAGETPAVVADPAAAAPAPPAA